MRSIALYQNKESIYTWHFRYFDNIITEDAQCTEYRILVLTISTNARVYTCNI